MPGRTRPGQYSAGTRTAPRGRPHLERVDEDERVDDRRVERERKRADAAAAAEIEVPVREPEERDRPHAERNRGAPRPAGVPGRVLRAQPGDLEDGERAIAKLMARFLASVSFESGAHPEYSSLPSLFVEGARLVRTASGQPESIGIDEFVRDRTEQVRSGQLDAFAERETAQVTERFGNVADRKSVV